MLITQSGREKTIKYPPKNTPIQSFIYYAAKLDKTELKAIKTKPLEK